MNVKLHLKKKKKKKKKCVSKVILLQVEKHFCCQQYTGRATLSFF